MTYYLDRNAVALKDFASILFLYHSYEEREHAEKPLKL